MIYKGFKIHRTSWANRPASVTVSGWMVFSSLAECEWWIIVHHFNRLVGVR